MKALLNYFKACYNIGNGNIRTALACLSVIALYGYYIPLLIIESL